MTVRESSPSPDEKPGESRPGQKPALLASGLVTAGALPHISPRVPQHLLREQGEWLAGSGHVYVCVGVPLGTVLLFSPMR